MSRPVLEGLAVTCAVTGTEMPEAAARAIVTALAAYPEQAVLAALARCQREIHGRLSLAAILERIDDGRPGPEEAWAASPLNERMAVVWTPEWSEAYFAALPHIEAGETIAARMTFIEVYRRRVAEARASGRAPRWVLSHGWDKAETENAVVEAARIGRITSERALQLLPQIDPERLPTALIEAPQAHAALPRPQ